MKLRDYPCPQADPAAIDEAKLLADLAELDVHFPDVFTDPAMYARYVIHEFGGDKLLTLPLDHALEAESYGATIVPGDALHDLRLKEPASGSLADIQNLPEVDFTKGRFPIVFSSLHALNSEAYTAGLSLAGPYTFYGALIPLKRLLIASRRDPEALIPLFMQMIAIHLAILRESQQYGAQFALLGDPTGSYLVLGPKGFEQSLRHYVVPLLRQVLDETDMNIVLCPKYRLGLESLGLLAKEVHELPADMTYGDALLHVFDKARIFGDRCPNESRKTRKILTYELKEPHEA